MSAAAARSGPYAIRLAAVRRALPAAGVDALLVTHPPNLRYLVGFEGSAGALLLSQAGAVLVVDGRYLTAVRERFAAHEDLRALGLVLVERTYEEAIARTVAGTPAIGTLGVEAAAITLGRYEKLAAALAAAAPGRQPILKGTERVVERSRLVKDATEIAILREAATRLSRAAVDVLASVQVGRRERDVAAGIDATLRAAGFERPAFETIVASGPNSALPHARPGDRVLQASDPVVLDFGGVYNGYCVDLTRTVELPPGTPGFARLFEAVRAAQAAAIAAIRPGVRTTDVDAAARRVLEERGLGDAFVHGTGHGLGLEVHEEPRIARAWPGAADEALVSGMVFTIEPGAYLPGVAGVRIEDDVLVLDQGCEVLTQVPIVRQSGVGGGRSARGSGPRKGPTSRKTNEPR